METYICIVEEVKEKLPSVVNGYFYSERIGEK